VNDERMPSQELFIAKRSIDDLKDALLLSEWAWNASTEEWLLHCELSLDTKLEGAIPLSTKWYVVVDQNYPWGNIKFYPAKEGGIVQTFPHQSYNGIGKEKQSWREGGLCLDTSIRALGRQGYDSEPREPHNRLRWHFKRALEWIKAASIGELFLTGEPFELPHFPGAVESSSTIAFSENADSFEKWQDTAETIGIVEFIPFHREPELFVVKRFLSVNENELSTCSWGRVLRDIKGKPLKGIWLRLESTPVIPPWQAPLTWNELRNIFHSQQSDFDELLKRVSKLIRDELRHIALIGFPIPNRIGDAPSRMHWQALKLPQLSGGHKPFNGGHKTPKGFRPTERWYWEQDRIRTFGATTPIEWLKSENWDIEQISTRGRLPEPLPSKAVLLIGSGALGSALSEFLVRAGVYNVTVMDGDKLAVGNLTRHNLGLDDLGMDKALRQANHLNLASPHISAQDINAEFPPLLERDRVKVQNCEVIIDCTGSDEALYHLETFPWREPKLFFSFSVGFKSRRLYCFTAHGKAFPNSIFKNAISPWLQRDITEYGGQELPREGIGCWHPVFPARIDDIWMMSTIAIKYIESILAASTIKPDLTVFEQHYEGGFFDGVRRINNQVCDEQH